MVRTFRNSEIKQFMDCPRQWWLRYHRKLVRRHVELAEEEASKAEQGTSYHEYLDAHYRGEPLSTKEEPDRLVARMVDGYFEWLAETGADQGLTVVAVERQIEVPFETFHGDEVVLTGKLDLEVLDEWGNPKIIDHKTVQGLGQSPPLYIDFQGRTYSLLRKLEGSPVRGFIHNQARRTLRTARATPPFYGREEVYYNDIILNAHEEHLTGVISRMVLVAQALESGELSSLEVPPNPSKDCGWQCPFVDVCGMFDDGSDIEGLLEELYVPWDTLGEQEKEGI